MTKEALRTAFRRLYWFEKLSDADLSLLFPLVQCRQVEKETPLFNEGDPANGVHFVLNGLVKVIRTSEDGREHILRLVQPGFVDAAYVECEGNLDLSALRKAFHKADQPPLNTVRCSMIDV